MHLFVVSIAQEMSQMLLNFAGNWVAADHKDSTY